MRVASLPRLATALLLFALHASSPAWAGDLQAAPILLEFGNGQHSQSLWLTNTGQQPLRAQVRVQQWTQADAQELLHPSDLLLASPPLVDIAPGQRQLVRVVQADPAAHTTEAAFRLIVDELPGSADTPTSGLQFLLRYSIPVFVLPVGMVPQLERTSAPVPTDVTLLQGSWQQRADRFELTLHNHGVQRIRISQLYWVTPSGQRIELSAGLLGYVLAGQQMRFNLSLSAPLPTTGTLHARLNDDVHSQPLPQINRQP